MEVRSVPSCARWIPLLAGSSPCSRAHSSGDVLPRDGGRLANDFFVCARQIDQGRSLQSPRSAGWPERRMRLNESRLLIDRELHHRRGLVSVQRGEDSTAHAEIRMRHMRFFLRAGEGEGDSAEFVPGRHLSGSAGASRLA